MAAVVECFARLLLRAAARRSADLHQEWCAELFHLRSRPWQMLTFAGSLFTARIPARALTASATGAALVVLLAAALFNGVHLVLHLAETRLPWSGEALLVAASLAVSTLAMAGAGTCWRPRSPIRAAILTGGAAFAFLLAGNETAVMPFMGWRDVTPAVATWTAVTALTAWATLRFRSTGRTRPAAATAIIGGLLAVHASAVAGSLHAAATLGVPAATAPAWFPLAMLPGGTGGFGTYFPDGRATFGGLHSTGPAFHASDILLANAAALTGPLLLCTAFLTAALLTAPRPAGTRLSRAGAIQSRASRLISPIRRRIDPLILAATSTAAAVLLLAGHLPRAATPELTLPRVIDNSTVFGFGFLAHPAGRAALAFAVALLLSHHLATRHRTAEPQHA
ncbi:hypothetical protein OHA21_45565 [Actinoplanes sp. NBC_00393]|uniref:hypothetical protein n=1 Tax=Actinoplanes sp. NBC_00393 TaxID=2975953 RepID=UPI002E1FFBB6